MKRIAAVGLGGGLVLIALTAGAGSEVGLSVSPRVAFAPTNLRISVMADRHADNRILRVIAESEDFASSSDRPLEGEDSPRVATFELRDVPAGDYMIRALLIGDHGQVRAQARAQAKVISVTGP